MCIAVHFKVLIVCLVRFKLDSSGDPAMLSPAQGRARCPSALPLTNVPCSRESVGAARPLPWADVQSLYHDTIYMVASQICVCLPQPASVEHHSPPMRGHLFS